MANLSSDQLKQAAKQLLASMDEGDELTEDKIVDVRHSGDTKQIVLPDGMDCQQAITWLKRKDEEESREVNISEPIDAYPLDGALALTKAMAAKYGWTNLVPTPGFFGRQNPPSMIGVQVGPRENDVVQVPWGRMRIPGVDGYIESEFAFVDGQPRFVLSGTVKRKHEHEVSELAKLARQFIKQESIYRGKALRMRFPTMKEVSSLDDFNPKYIDLSGVREHELIFPEEVDRQVAVNLFTPVEKTALCRQHKIPLKRGILLEGPFGCGKTLTANVTAKKCTDNGWTFVYLEKVDRLDQAIRFARRYGPAVVFAEDIDQILSGERDAEVNKLLNTIDGVDTKGTEVVVVLTTNHVENISTAMLRPGRLDAVISVTPPDAVAAQKLMRLYARELLQPEEDISEVGEFLAGRIPAVIREVVERSKLSAILHTEPGQPLYVHASDLQTAAQSMLSHLELLQPEEEDDRSDEEKAAGVLAEGLVEAATALVSGFALPPGLVEAGTNHALPSSPAPVKEIPKRI